MLKSFLWCVVPQAVLFLHSQVGCIVQQVADQYKELFGASLLHNCSQQQMMIELMGALCVTGRYVAFKEQMKVGIAVSRAVLLVWICATLFMQCVFLLCSMQSLG